MPELRDRQLDRTRRAFDAVNGHVGLCNEQQDKLSKRLRELPAMLHACGLRVVVPILVARGEKDDSYALAAEMLFDGVLPDPIPAASEQVSPADQKKPLLGKLKQKCQEMLKVQDAREHRLLQLQAVAYAEALKRWGEALLFSE